MFAVRGHFSRALGVSDIASVSVFVEKTGEGRIYKVPNRPFHG
jgi:hypothetical protein